MRIHFSAVLATLLTWAGVATAGSGPYGSMSVFEYCKLRRCEKKAAACEACCPPTQTIPSPTLFRAEVGCPTLVEGKPLPPIQLFRAVPPPVELVAGRPPCLEIIQVSPPPVELVRGTPPPVGLFRRQPAPLGHAPPFQMPSVTLYHVQQPPKPCVPPPVCAPCCGTNGN
jgi:hypothetical protein